MHGCAHCADDGWAGLARTVDPHGVHGKREPALDRLLGDGAALAALGLILANVRKWHDAAVAEELLQFRN